MKGIVMLVLVAFLNAIEISPFADGKGYAMALKYAKKHMGDDDIKKALSNPDDKEPMSVFLKAAAYQYHYNRFDLAEEYWMSLTEKPRFLKESPAVYMYADFLSSVGKAKEALSVLDAHRCQIGQRYRDACDYTKGVAKFIAENKASAFLYRAARKYEIPREMIKKAER